MERQIRLRMKALYNSLVYGMHEHFYSGNSSDDSWKRAREKAHSFAINVHLNRAFNRASILEALCRIRNEAGPKASFFNAEEADWIAQQAEENPADVRSLLMFACETYSPKKAAGDVAIPDDPNDPNEDLPSGQDEDPPEAPTFPSEKE